MKMKKWTILILIAMTLSLMSCSTDKSSEPENYADFINNDEDIHYKGVETNQFIESDELKERLLESAAIELKDVDNHTIGMLREKEKIANFVEGLFTYKVEEDYTTNKQGQVVGPINFYFADNEDIYGLMNNEYIYIEGYYFFINNKKSQELQNFFKTNTAPAPVAGE
ncbi:hypothetical protein [Clostridium formicaceticum]|uniref:DUF4830 domain-containing protein n=1 Tax=Clostridium formicaceticum TaxID=1497 RepID=A0AAC9WHS5_9CLOT|nr:hypothetical protein [Clostridium formicaceticum]AOY77448.1 hypothetical protein BJL90_17265 [Clostridium formicaceticum]ARE88005.1 hypothetical protein CLFO_24060 [Clostridium formicaceticum]